MSSDEYDTSDLFRFRYPEWEPLANGRSRRVWRFEFEKPVPATLGDLSEGDLTVSTQAGSTPADLIVAVECDTAKTHSDDNFLVGQWRLFRRLEAAAGRLKTIQGHDRNLWVPFRTR